MAQDTPLEPLTRREREILTLLSQNLTDREIAERLVIAPTTVKWFKRQIFNKLGVENRQEAVQRAVSLGLLDSDDAKAMPWQNLPTPLTPFIGRAGELSEVRRWLSHPHTRLVTLLAPGGMGKTRLAVEIAASMLGSYKDGVCFVPLAGLTSSDPFIATLIDALALQFPPDGRSPRQQLFDTLRRKHLLIVLDNFEHLLDCALLVADLLTAAPYIKVLVTSRERLNITGEIVYPLTGLEVSASDTDDISRSDAGQLFVVCAQRASPHFAAGDMRSIARVCRLVQGMPLAIELAAAWAGTLSTAEIAQEVGRSVDFLQTAMPNVPERLRSVRVVFEAAWARLTDDARQVFRRLSVFRGGCTREAAQVVTGAHVTTLALLVDSALLWRNTRIERYEVHELLRQYAEQQLETTGEADQIRYAHRQYYAQLVTTWGAALQTDKMLEGLTRLDADAENIRMALTHATLYATPEAIEPFADLWVYYDLRNQWVDGDHAFIAAGNAIEPHDSLALAKLLTGRAIFYERLFLFEQELEVGKRAYEMALRLGARRALPLAMIAYADALRDLGRHEETLPIYQEGLALSREIDFPLMTVTFTFHLAKDAERNGRLEEAVARMRDAYSGAAQLNNLWAMCFCMNRLAHFALRKDDLDEAQRLYQELLEMARAIRFNYLIDRALSGLSSIARQHSDWQTVYRLSLETLRMRYDTATVEQVSNVLVSISEAAFMLNELDEGRQRVHETLRLWSERTVAEQVLRGWGSELFLRLLFIASGLLVRTGDYTRAVMLLSHAEEASARLNSDELVFKPFTRFLPELLNECRAALTLDAFAASVERGKALTLDEALTALSVIR